MKEMQAGTWVRFNPHAAIAGRYGRFVRRDGNLFLIQTDGSQGEVSAVRADFVISREQNAPHDMFPMRKTLPYGVYICADGSKVLHNRDYEPLVRLHADGRREACDPKEWIEHVGQDHFYDDSNQPWKSFETERRVRSLLHP